MFELKSLSEEGVPAALEKAVRYRLLNEPLEAESICLDVLKVEANNQDALITLLLALTDQFENRMQEKYSQARGVLAKFEDAYAKVYYDGIICERRGKASFERGGPGSGHVAYEWFRQAMDLYEQADAMSPAENDDAILRWNTCARIIMRNADLKPEPKQTMPSFLE